VNQVRFQATVVITTKDRRDDLRRALSSAVAQVPPVEVLVVDDGSSDGTSEMVRQEFPQVVLHRNEKPTGYIVGRNLAARLATAPAIFSIDDDAEFSTPHTVAQTLAELAHPCVGAVAIPHVDVKKRPGTVLPFPPDPGEGTFHVLYSYIGTAHAVRRDLFLSLGGYREALFHQGEEKDFTLRMLDAGYVVRLGRADRINHYESPRRDTTRMSLYGRRNDVLHVWHNTPWPWMPGDLVGTTVKGLSYGLRTGRLWLMARGLAKGYGAMLTRLGRRTPIRPAAYRLWRRIMRDGPLTFDQVEADVAGLRQGAK
jgi:glycosyltransferase involved in cell wall biosynthesis